MNAVPFNVSTPAGLAKFKGKKIGPAMDPDKIRQLQREYAQKATQGRTGAGNIFQLPKLATNAPV